MRASPTSFQLLRSRVVVGRDTRILWLAFFGPEPACSGLVAQWRVIIACPAAHWPCHAHVHHG